jgi:uncharacterized membrane protein YkoI
MKKILLLILLCTASVSFSQTNVPEKVKVSFDKKFPKAANVKWSLDDEEYSAEFNVDSTNYFAGFSEDGKWTETGTSVTVENLPEAVLRVIKNKLKDNEVKNLYSVEDSGGQVYYEVDIMKDGKIVELYYNKDGSVVND